MSHSRSRSGAKRAIAAIAVLAVLGLGGCSGSAEDSDIGMPSSVDGGVDDSGGEVAPDFDGGVTGEDSDGNSGTGGGKSDVDIASLATDERSIIYSASLDIETDDVNKAVDKATLVTTSAGGYIENASVSGGGNADGQKSAEMALRIPVDKLDKAIADISALGEVRSKSVSAQDITAELVDVESRIVSMTASLVRLRKLLDEADSLAIVVSLEGEITNRQAELDSLKQQQKTLSGLAALSTLNVYFAQPGGTFSTDDERGGGFLAGLQSGWDALRESVYVILTMVGALLPFAVVGLVLGAPLVWWMRRRRANRPASTTTPMMWPSVTPGTPGTPSQPTSPTQAAGQPSDQSPAG